MYVSFEPPVYTLSNAKLVLVSLAAGGNACGATYRLITIENNTATPSEEFGNCSTPEVTPAADHIDFTFYKSYGSREVETYKNGTFTKSLLTLPPNENPSNNGKDFSHLATQTDRDNVENILTDSALAPTLTALMGSDFEKLKERLEVMSDPVTQDDYLILEGAMSHAFTIEEGFLAVSLSGKQVYAAILTLAPDTSGATIVRAYTNGNTAVDAPAAMQAWLQSHPESKVSWKAP